jgi:transposase
MRGKPSQRCPQCWHVAKKQLSQRMHCCEQCGHQENRDTASARVVLRWALESISGQELAETGVQRIPLYTSQRSNRLARAENRSEETRGVGARNVGK